MPKYADKDTPVGTRVVRSDQWAYGSEDGRLHPEQAGEFLGTLVAISGGIYAQVTWDKGRNLNYAFKHIFIYEEPSNDIIVNNQKPNTDAKAIVSSETTAVKGGPEQKYRSLNCSVEATIVARFDNQNRRVSSTG